MSSFRDAEGHTWTLDVTYGHLSRIKSELKLDYLSNEPGVAAASMTSSMTRADLIISQLCILLEKQIDKLADCDDEQFLYRLSGDAFAEARAALLEALQNFFQKSGYQHMAVILGKTEQTRQAQMEGFAKQVNDLPTEKLASGPLRTSGQALSELIQKTTASDN